MQTSDFAHNFVKGLSVSRPASPPPTPPSEEFLSDPESPTVNAAPVHATNSPRKPALHGLLVSVNQQRTVTPSEVGQFVKNFKEILLGYHDEHDTSSGTSRSLRVVEDAEEEAMKAEILKRLTLSLYTDALEISMLQAIQVESDVEWWRNIEESTTALVFYSIQTLPGRLYNVAKTLASILQTELHIRQETFTLSPSAILRLLSPSLTSPVFSLRAGVLLVAFFPFLREQNEQQTLTTAVLFGSQAPKPAVTPAELKGLRERIAYLRELIAHVLDTAWRLTTLPLLLAQQECRYKRKALEKIRDNRAATLGHLALIRGGLGFVSSSPHQLDIDGRRKKFTSFLDTLVRVVSPSVAKSRYEDSDPLSLLTRLSTVFLPELASSHAEEVTQLMRPSTLTQLWPQLVFIPPVALYIYTCRSDWIPKLVEFASDAKETIRGFIWGWLIQPVADIIRTVRAGSGEGDIRARIVSAEGVASDVESLQRMSLSLASDFLGYTKDQLDALATQIERGDMTPVMEIYEEDMRHPFKGVVRSGGRLIRGVLIQVQKAKVDIDYALRGIDHLLKSQELTFALVGLSPALLIVYLASGAFRGLWRGGRIGGRFGGKLRRRAAWDGVRRVEKILILQGSASLPGSAIGLQLRGIQLPTTALAPLPTGLLMLSLMQLRSWANGFLPLDIRGPFLEDLDMLEDPELGREEKLLVIGRVWRIWKDIGQ